MPGQALGPLVHSKNDNIIDLCLVKLLVHRKNDKSFENLCKCPNIRLMHGSLVYGKDKFLCKVHSERASLPS